MCILSHMNYSSSSVSSLLTIHSQFLLEKIANTLIKYTQAPENVPTLFLSFPFPEYVENELPMNVSL